MYSWPNMPEILKPVKGKEFEIVHWELSEQDLKFMKLRDAINGSMESLGQKPGVVVQLRNKHGEVIMADTAMEKRTNEDVLWQVHGDILLGGLGLGLVPLAAQELKGVTSITIVELHQEIIDLVVPQLPLDAKVTVIHGDIFKWYPPKGVLYDIIYFDIWNSVCGDNYKGMKKLHRRFAKRLNRVNSNCWMGSWRRAECKLACKREPHYG